MDGVQWYSAGHVRRRRQRSCNPGSYCNACQICRDESWEAEGNGWGVKAILCQITLFALVKSSAN